MKTNGYKDPASVATGGLGPIDKLSLRDRGFGPDGAIPIAMGCVTVEGDGVHLLVGDLHAGRVGVRVDLAADLQAGVRRGGGDPLDDGLETDQRLATPVLGDEREANVARIEPKAIRRRCGESPGFR